jgi:hypothetical protein
LNNVRNIHPHGLACIAPMGVKHELARARKSRHLSHLICQIKHNLEAEGASQLPWASKGHQYRKIKSCVVLFGRWRAPSSKTRVATLFSKLLQTDCSQPAPADRLQETTLACHSSSTNGNTISAVWSNNTAERSRNMADPLPCVDTRH